MPLPTDPIQFPFIHRRTISFGDTDAAAGPSDLDSRVHRWLNPVIRVTITVTN